MRKSTFLRFVCVPGMILFLRVHSTIPAGPPRDYFYGCMFQFFLVLVTKRGNAEEKEEGCLGPFTLNGKERNEEKNPPFLLARERAYEQQGDETEEAAIVPFTGLLRA